MATDPFKLPGDFLKGNLHTHTTTSDGQLSPQAAVDLYRTNGYDFLAITDHRALTRTDNLKTDGLTMLPGMELHPGTGELGQIHHVVAIGMQTPIELEPTESLRAGLTQIAARCRFAFIAHPYWTSMTHRDLLGAGGNIGVEVFNYTCHCGIGRGESAVHWDQLLARGERPFGFAVDDSHLHYWDACGGWIMVKSAGRDPESIISAVMAGAFYASSGPTIEDVTFEPGSVTVRCSPCQAVYVICPQAGCGTTTHRLERDGGPYTEVSLPVHESWRPVRIECVDERGRKAWTNPFWFE